MPPPIIRILLFGGAIFTALAGLGKASERWTKFADARAIVSAAEEASQKAAAAKQQTQGAIWLPGPNAVAKTIPDPETTP